jgi:hypothetical protein
MLKRIGVKEAKANQFRVLFLVSTQNLSAAVIGSVVPDNDFEGKCAHLCEKAIQQGFQILALVVHR